MPPNCPTSGVHLTVSATEPGISPLPAEIDLMGLANADSYTFKNDMLKIYDGSKIIDMLRLHDSTTDGFTVQKTASSVNIVAITDPTHLPVGLPIHVDDAPTITRSPLMS